LTRFLHILTVKRGKLGSGVMPEVLPTRGVNRWYQVTRSGSNEPWQVFAERYFDSKSEAFAYWESRSAELGYDRVCRPLHSHEDPVIWAVCIDP
jgi:hypothetical protein